MLPHGLDRIDCFCCENQFLNVRSKEQQVQDLSHACTREPEFAGDRRAICNSAAVDRALEVMSQSEQARDTRRLSRGRRDRVTASPTYDGADQHDRMFRG